MHCSAQAGRVARCGRCATRTSLDVRCHSGSRLSSLTLHRTLSFILDCSIVR